MKVIGISPLDKDSTVTLVEADGEGVSSSHIRGLILAGDVEQAGRLLLGPFHVLGRADQAAAPGLEGGRHPLAEHVGGRAGVALDR